MGEKGEGSEAEGGGKWGERGRELGMGYLPVHPLSIRTACESCWKKGLLIKTRYGRDNILYKLDDEVPHTSTAETIRLGKTEESTLKQDEIPTPKQKSSVCKSKAPETDTILKTNLSSKRQSVTKRKEMGKIGRLEK